MSKHTPGPWECAKMRISPQAEDRRCGFVVNGPDVESASILPTRICDLRVPSGIAGYAEGQANARLIAAAPDLLDALTHLQQEIRRAVKFDVKKHYSLMLADSAASKAIAKAEGRE